MAHYKSKKGKRQDDDFSVDSILERAAESRNGTDGAPIDAWESRRHKIRAPHALTPDELLGGRNAQSESPAPQSAGEAPRRSVQSIPMEHKGEEAPPGHSLYERMMQAKSHPETVSPEEADLALKAFAAALPSEKPVQNSESDQPADSLRAKTRLFTQQEETPSRAPRRISSLDVGNVDDIIRRFEEKARSRAADLYGETEEPSAPPSPAAKKSSSAPALFDWEKDEKENKDLPLYGPEADVQPLPIRRDRPVFQVQQASAPVAAAEPLSAPSTRNDPISPAIDPDAPADSASPLIKTEPTVKVASEIDTPQKTAFPAAPPSRPANQGEKAFSGRIADSEAPVSTDSAPEIIPTVRVAAVRKVRRFSTPARGEESSASRQDAQPLAVEISRLTPQSEQPIMTTSPTSGTPNLRFPESLVKKDPAESVRAAASQFSLADGGLTGADQVYKKKRPVSNPEEEEGKEEISSFSDPALAQRGVHSPAAAFLQKPVRQPVPAASATDATMQFKIPVADAQVPPIAGGKDVSGSGKRKVILFGGAEEENAPEEMPPQTEYEDPEEIEDYQSTADADSIRIDLRARSRRLKLRFVPTLLITLALFLLASPLTEPFKAANLTLYLILNISLICLAGLINLNTMRGLGSLFRLKPDMDAPAALAVIGVLAHSIVMLVSGHASDAPQLGGLAAMALLFNGLGKMTLLTRIRRNFRLIADDKEKEAVFLLDDPAVTTPLAEDSVIGEALICTRRKTIHPQNFLQHSYCVDPYEKITRKLVLAALAAAAIVGIIAGLFTGLPAGLNVAAVFLCLACPPASLLLSNLPLKMAAGKLNEQGAVLTGYQAVEDLSYANAVTFSADELFPAGTVKLFNMHLLSANPLDEAILQAAAVARKAHSPVFHIFRQMLDSENGLPQADNVTYEDRLGLSGWIGKTRVLIGNRNLMDAHGVKTPPPDIDKKILRSGGFPVYLAVDGQPSCLFVVGYEPDEEIAYELQRLSATGVTLLIDSSDPNLTPQMICDYFSLYGESVRFIPAAASPLLEQVTEPALKADAPALYRGSAAGLAAVLTAAIRIKSSISASTAIHIAGICLGAALTAYFTFAGLTTFIAALPIAAYQLVCTLCTCIVPLIHKP